MMTSRFAKIAVAVGAIGLAGGLQSSVQAASTTATATAVVATAIGIAKTIDMSFGTIAGGGSTGTVILATDGSRTTTGGTSVLSGSPGAAASFNVTGEGANTYTITLPGSVTLTGPGSPATDMDATAFISLPSGTGTLTAGAQTLLVGATLAVANAATQTAGAYTSATFTVTVNYN